MYVTAQTNMYLNGTVWRDSNMSRDSSYRCVPGKKSAPWVIYLRPWLSDMCATCIVLDEDMCARAHFNSILISVMSDWHICIVDANHVPQVSQRCATWHICMRHNFQTYLNACRMTIWYACHGFYSDRHSRLTAHFMVGGKKETSKK